MLNMQSCSFQPHPLPQSEDREYFFFSRWLVYAKFAWELLS